MALEPDGEKWKRMSHSLGALWPPTSGEANCQRRRLAGRGRRNTCWGRKNRARLRRRCRWDRRERGRRRERLHEWWRGLSRRRRAKPGRGLHRARETTRKCSAHLREGTYRCARKQGLGRPPANFAAVPQSFSRRQFSASFVSQAGQTFSELAWFHGAPAVRPEFAGPRLEQTLLRRTTRNRTDGRGFSVTQRWRRELEEQRRQERHSWGEQEFASAGSRLADAWLVLARLPEVRRTLGLAALQQAPPEPERAERPKEKWNVRQRQRRPWD